MAARASWAALSTGRRPDRPTRQSALGDNPSGGSVPQRVFSERQVGAGRRFRRRVVAGIVVVVLGSPELGLHPRPDQVVRSAVGMAVRQSCDSPPEVSAKQCE